MGGLVRIPRIAQRDTFGPLVGDRVLLRRTAGAFLVLTRSAMTALGGANGSSERIRIGERFCHEARGLLNRLRALDLTDAEGFPRVVARLLPRFDEIQAGLPALCDARATLSLLRAELMVLAGELDAAWTALEPLMCAITRVQNSDLRDEIAERFLDLSIAELRVRDGAATFLAYLADRLAHGGSGLRFARHLRLLADHPAIPRAMGLAWTGRVLRSWDRVARILPRRLAAPIADLVLQRVGSPVIRRELRRIVLVAGPPRVVRAMGGIGDLLMMTPGLRALAKRVGQPIPFGVPGRFLPLFEACPWLEARALEELPASWFSAGPVIDLTDCPAARVESRSAPRIQVNRIEIFARAMGVTPAELRASGLRPMFEPSEEGRRDAADWLRARGLRGRDFIAVQAASAEAYRTWLGMAETARSLAQFMPVVVFDDKPPPGFDARHPADANIRFAINLNLAAGFALACEARLIVAPDSAFVHLAGARGIPCVSIFGPTDGALRTGSYDHSVVVSRAGELPCVPCWRNQRIPCMLTGGMTSQCLQSLSVETVVAVAKAQIAAIGCAA